MQRTITMTALISIATLVAPGCDDGATYSTSTPTTTGASPAPVPADAGQPSAGPTNKRQSSSVLGKARDKALDVRDQMEARDREIQKQLDDIQP